MLDKEHGGLKGEQQILELHPGEDIDKVQRLIPEKEVRRLAQRFCQEHLFLLSLAVVLDPLFKLCAFHPEFPQDSEEQRLADAVSDSKLREGAAQVRGVLGDVGDDKTACGPDLPGVRDIFTKDQLHQARLAAAVLSGQGDAVALTDLQTEVFHQGRRISVPNSDIFQ